MLLGIIRILPMQQDEYITLKVIILQNKLAETIKLLKQM